MEANTEEGDSDMSWKYDSPKVIYQDPRTFAEYGRGVKRPFDRFAEGQGQGGVQQTRNPFDYSEARTLDQDAEFDPSWQEGGIDTREDNRAWRYMRRTCEVAANLTIRTITHPINIAVWKFVYGTYRHVLGQNQRIDTTLTAVEHIAGGAKRRCVEFVTHIAQRYKPLSDAERRRRQQYRARRASGYRHGPMQPTQEEVYEILQDDPQSDEGFFMSGALSDEDFEEADYPGEMPGSWCESPVAPVVGRPHSTRRKPRITYDDLVDHVYVSGDTAVSSLIEPAIASIKDSNTIATSPETTTTTTSAWPYCGNEIYHVELKQMDIDDEDSFTVQDGSTRSLEPTATSGNSDTIPPSDPKDLLMSDSESDSSELDSITADLEHTTSYRESRFDPMALRYSQPNPNPDPIQRAVVDEMQEILDEDTIMSESSEDQRSPVTPASSQGDSISVLGSPPTSQLTPEVNSEPLPLNASISSSSTASTQASVASQQKSSPKWSPAMSQSATPEQEISASPPQSSVGPPMVPPELFVPQPVESIKGEPMKKRRVTFFQSPKTGGPVDRYKKYIPSESIDVSYVSTSTDEDHSMLSDLTPSAQLHTSPSWPEQLERQLLIDRKDQELLRSLSSYLPVTDAPPHIPDAPPPRVFAQIPNGRARQRRVTSNFAVTADGSPMRLGPSSTETQANANLLADETLTFTKDSFSGKENSSPLSQVDVSAESSLDVSTSQKAPSSPVTTHGMDFNSSGANLAHGKGYHSNGNSRPDQATPFATAADPPSEESLTSGEDTFSSDDYPLPDQIESSSGLVTPSPSSSQESSMQATDTPSGDFSPSNQFVTATPTPGSHEKPAEETPVNGKDAESTASPSTRVEASATNSTPEQSLAAEGTLVIGKDSPSVKNGSSPSDQVDAPATPSPSPSQVANVARQLEGLNVSNRRSSLRQVTKARKIAERRAAEEARIAAEKARKEKEEAEEKARKKKEREEERKRTGARRLPTQKVIKPLSDEWEAKVDKAMHEPMTKVITTSVAMTEITRRDLGKVLPQPGVPGEDARGWLNDTVITAYLDTAVDYALTASGHKRGEVPTQVALSSYFYPKLAGTGAASVSRWVKRAKIEGKKMMNVERIYIPVNHHGMHWTLLVISPKFKLIEYFDSFHGEFNTVIANAKALLKEELKADFKEEEWRIVGRGGPRQANGSDCGAFVCTTAKMISLGVDPMHYSAEDIPVQRRRIVAELINRGFEGELAPDVVFPEDD